jgi:hypothetical protein
MATTARHKLTHQNLSFSSETKYISNKTLISDSTQIEYTLYLLFKENHMATAARHNGGALTTTINNTKKEKEKEKSNNTRIQKDTQIFQHQRYHGYQQHNNNIIKQLLSFVFAGSCKTVGQGRNVSQSTL